jgi:hypothetical protein
LELVSGPTSALARRLADEPELRRRLALERLSAAACAELEAAGLLDELPVDYAAQLRQARLEVLRRQLILEGLTVALTRLAGEIQPVVLKGVHFARLLYPPGGRSSVDIDLFCPRRLYDELQRRLARGGWRAREHGAYARRIYRTWVHLSWQKDDRILEVHFDLVPPGRYRGYDELWTNRRPLELESGRVYVPRLEDAALFALAHLAKEHLFEHHLLWVLDLHRLAPLVDWATVKGNARRCGLEGLYDFALAYLRRFPALRRRLPAGTALPADDYRFRLLKSADRLQLRARLLGLLLCQSPARALTYGLSRLLWPLVRRAGERN